MQYIIPFSIWPYVAGFIVLISSSTLATIGLINGLVQLALFIAVVCIPVWRTGRMSYVDIGWPLGVLLIGVLTLALLQDGYWLRTLIVSLAYLLIGGRMGLGALHGWRKGWLQTELPRYQYQRIHWQTIGITNTRLRAKIEVQAKRISNSRPTAGIVTSMLSLVNQRDETIVSYLSKTLMGRQPTEKDG